jgi:uncharacterized membrane protein
MTHAAHDNGARGLTRAAFWLGFAVSGFFDGILLHQVLQWHHLLSAIRGDIRFQIAADGYFHLLMYAIAAIGLWLLWRARASLEHPGATRRFLAWLLIGFGVWHYLDAIASHWLLGIHRIKLDSANPLIWDLGWLLAFGVIPFAIGLMLRRGGPSIGARRNATMAIIALAISGAGYWASLPPPRQDFTTIVFAPTLPPAEAFATAVSVSDSITWYDGKGVAVVTGVSREEALALYTRGAMLVSGGGAAPGCFNWTAA